MCLKIINLFAISVTYSLIGQSFSLLYLNFGKKSLSAEYLRLKNSSVHRGTIFSLTDVQKREICEDMFGAQLFISSNQDPYRKRSINRKFFIYVYELIIQDTTPVDDISIHSMCRPFGIRERKPLFIQHDYFSAFRSKWFYLSNNIRLDSTKFHEVGSPINFITLSPDYVSIDPASVEQRYMDTRKTLMTLSRESPKYIELIEKKDNISNLTKLQKLVLCASILSTRTYRDEHLEWSLEWMKERYRTEASLDYETKTVSFRYILNDTEQDIKADCILCKAFEDGTVQDSKQTNLHLTRTFDDGFSLLVLKEEEDGIFPHKYFRNIAELITAQEDMNYDSFFLNFIDDKVPN